MNNLFDKCFRQHLIRQRNHIFERISPYRVGIVACLRSIYHKSATIGVMITASHNPPQDNGVKIIEPDGSMLIESWEGLARDLANTPDSNLDEKIKQISSEHKLELDHPCCVYIGYDTRATSVKFAKAVEAGVSKFKNGKSKNWGLCTTPLVHYYVACDSSRNDEVPYGVCSESGYYKKLGKAFEKLIELTGNKNSGQKVLVDCANGIGSKMLAKFDGTLKNSYFEAINDGSAGELNSLCGADFVKVKQGGLIIGWGRYIERHTNERIGTCENAKFHEKISFLQQKQMHAMLVNDHLACPTAIAHIYFAHIYFIYTLITFLILHFQTNTFSFFPFSSSKYTCLTFYFKFPTVLPNSLENHPTTTD